MAITVIVIPNRLTDGSETFNVQVREGEDRMTFHAVTDADADALAAKLAAAISEHTVDVCDPPRWADGWSLTPRRRS